MASPSFPALRWDIFCKVIDNHGDLGVCWRLSRDLASRGQQVRLWVDDARALDWMAPTGHPGVTVLPWTTPLPVDHLVPGEVLIEAFGCDPAPEYLALWAAQAGHKRQQAVWLNLEYLSAEAYVARQHGLVSPVLSGPASGMRKHFFYPGFTADSGGLLREPDLLNRQAPFKRSPWLEQHGVVLRPQERLISLFCYEPPALPELLVQWAQSHTPTRLLVTPGRAAQAVQVAVEALRITQPDWNASGQLVLHPLPYLSQADFDHLLWSCDLNFVRGEDSLVRALWAGQPFVWQIYPQDDLAHHDKLDAFLHSLKAPASLQQMHRFWNGMAHTPLLAWDALLLAEWAEWAEWTQWTHWAAAVRSVGLAQPDLGSRLLEFVAQQRAGGTQR